MYNFRSIVIGILAHVWFAVLYPITWSYLYLSFSDSHWIKEFPVISAGLFSFSIILNIAARYWKSFSFNIYIVGLSFFVTHNLCAIYKSYNILGELFSIYTLNLGVYHGLVFLFYLWVCKAIQMIIK